MDALPLDTPVRPYNRYSYRFDGDGRTDRASLQPLLVPSVLTFRSSIRKTLIACQLVQIYYLCFD